VAYTQPSRLIMCLVRYRAHSGCKGRRYPLLRRFGSFTLSSGHGAKWPERQYLTHGGTQMARLVRCLVGDVAWRL
jgi:hypothetical protein